MQTLSECNVTLCKGEVMEGHVVENLIGYAYIYHIWKVDGSADHLFFTSWLESYGFLSLTALFMVPREGKSLLQNSAIS